MNKFIGIGNLTKDPELRSTQSGIDVCTFTLAINGRDKEKTPLYLTVIAWRELAKLVAQYLAKGRKCAVVGTLQTRSYEANDGTKRHVTEVVADEVEFLTPRTDAGNGDHGYAPPPETTYTEVDEEEPLPF